VIAGVGHGQPGLTGQQIHGLFPLREQIQQLQAGCTGDGFADACELLEQVLFGGAQGVLPLLAFQILLE
jgi:hypothetical protein